MHCLFPEKFYIVAERKREVVLLFTRVEDKIKFARLVWSLHRYPLDESTSGYGRKVLPGEQGCKERLSIQLSFGVDFLYEEIKGIVLVLIRCEASCPYPSEQFFHICTLTELDADNCCVDKETDQRLSAFNLSISHWKTDDNIILLRQVP